MDDSLYRVLCCSLFFAMIRYAGIVKSLLRSWFCDECRGSRVRTVLCADACHRRGVLLQRARRRREGIFPWRPPYGPVGHGDERTGIRHVGVAADGSSRLDPGLRLWPDLDRYRPRPRYDRELGHRRAPSSLLLGGCERLDHASAVPV